MPGSRRQRLMALTTLAVMLAGSSVLAQMEWRRLFPTHNPPGRTVSGMAYDSARNRLVLFGGGRRGSPHPVSDTWEWDGTRWSRCAPVTSPRSRYGHAMAYDAARRRVVLFGGSVNHFWQLGDTWEWDGKNWTQRHPKTSPPVHTAHAMAYDTRRQRVVLFGGVGRSATWEWDGTNWTRCQPSTSPSMHYRHAMAYDAARQRVLLFGGFSGTSTSLQLAADTWEWDGKNWTKRSPATSPAGRHDHAMEYDPVRQRVVLLGGMPKGSVIPLNDTWEWDGKNWTKRSPAKSPPRQSGHVMAYDAGQKRVVVFGGGDYLNDTWAWDGTTWTNITPHSPTPPSREFGALAYDAARHRVVLFGGVKAATHYDDTWEWDGTKWIRCSPAASPPARKGHAMVYDAARRRVVLFGGSSAVAPGNQNDTWEWDGKTWTRRLPATSPPALFHHAMAFDTARRRVVLFGGRTITTWLNDTWEWDGKNWTKCSPTTTPQVLDSHAMAYDAARRRIVMFGGVRGWSQVNETWEWDGTNWTKCTPVTSPPPRSLFGMAYDAARQRTVVATRLLHDDTWEWDGSNWTKCAPGPTPRPWTPNGLAQEPMVYDSARGCMMMLFASDHEVWAYAPRDLTTSTHLISVATGGQAVLQVDAGAAHGGRAYWLLGTASGTGPGIQLTAKVKLLLTADWYFRFTVDAPNTLIANSLGMLDATGKAAPTINIPAGLPSTVIGLRLYHAYVVFNSKVDYASTPVPLTLTP